MNGENFQNIIAIPYRNREQHLHHFIEHSVPIIQKHMPNTKVVVVEQGNDKLFNRGMLLNVAFKEYKTKTKYFITHDVDINPTEIFVSNHYNSDVEPFTVQGLFTSVWNTLGGIVKISSEDVHTLNGFPNDIWGWGAEDTALQKRVEFFGLKITKFLVNDKTDKSKFLQRFDDMNDRNPCNNSKNHALYTNHFPSLSDEKKKEMIFGSGLNCMEYRIISRESIHEGGELITVDM